MSRRAIAMGILACLSMAVMVTPYPACAAGGENEPAQDAANDPGADPIRERVKDVPADPPKAQAKDGVGKLPHVTFDVKKRQVRVDCESLDVDAPLEFFCVVSGTAEHESVLRTPVKPSDLHTALLAVGLEPGEPVRYSEGLKKWLPPRGPPLQISIEWAKDGKTIAYPANRLMRNVKTQKEMPATTWIFAGSRQMPDGNYAADATGYVVSVVNFDLTVIDIPQLASNSNELLEWQRNPALVPPRGTKVTMVIEPAGGRGGAGGDVGERAVKKPPAAAVAEPAAPNISMPLVKVDADGHVALDQKPVTLAELTAQLEAMKASRPVKVRMSFAPQLGREYLELVRDAVTSAGVEHEIEAPPPLAVAAAEDTATDDVPSPDAQAEEGEGGGGGALSGVHADEEKINDLVAKWEKAFRPHRQALQDAAQTHYQTISALRREQQRLIDEADRIQRAIDRLEREYNDSVTPHPPQEQPGAARPDAEDTTEEGAGEDEVADPTAPE
jgi:hypothetical protein